MKQGFKGHQSSCSAPFEVWGADSTGPSMMEFGNDDTHNHPWMPYGVGFPYNHTYDDEFNSVVEVKKKIIPEPPWGDPANGKNFPLMAAKVPASYPGVACTAFPPTSSYAEGIWSANLGNRTETRELTVGEEIRPFVTAPRSTLSSRAIYIDGEQRYLNYRCTALIPGLTNAVLETAEGWSITMAGGFSSRPVDMGSHHVIEIANPINTDSYNVEYFGLASDGNFDTNITKMENGILMCMGSAPILTGPHPAPSQLSSYNFCCGKDYFLCTSYSPDLDGPWHVGRIKYQGTRTTPSNETQSGLETFASQHLPSAPVWNYIGQGDVGTDHEGEYAIVLPSIRSYIDSSVEITEAHPTDECWVIAARVKESDTPGIVAAQWIKKVFRSSIGDANDATGAADGTLHNDDVEAGQLILDPSLSTWSLDTWENVKIRCYNRVYNKRTGHSSNLAIFTSGAASTSVNSPFTADFEIEDGGSYDPGYFDHNLPEDYHFSTYGIGWDPGAWSVESKAGHSGTSMVAVAHPHPSISSSSELEISFNPTVESAVTFWYKLDNRGSGQRFLGQGFEFNELTNNPNTENNLKVYLDGGLASMTIDFGSHRDGGPVGPEAVVGLIDNSLLKNEEDSYIWYQASITVPAGSHTLRWSVTRGVPDDYGHLDAYLDDVVFPESMAGSDINGVKRWYFDGTQIRKAEHWAWAKKNEEGVSAPGTPDPIASRGSTVPDFITMDSEGDILYGNCHYVVKIRMDEGHKGELDQTFGGPKGEGIGTGGGYVRFTATPNIEVPPEPPCDDPDVVWTNAIDVDSNPPWGAFQILPTSAGFQIRGANSAIRDATSYPIDRDYFHYKDPRTGDDTPEVFFEYLNCRFSGCFPNRPHAWTVSRDGKSLSPHLMVYWRPAMYCMAWPEAPDENGDYPSPPYRADFNTLTPADISIEGGPYQQSGQGIPGLFRYRNVLKYPLHAKNKIFWDMKNWIIPNNYSANLYRIPQCCWVSITDDPPDNPASPYYYIPDGPNPPVGDPANNPFPWFSARWVLVFLYSYLTSGYSQPFIKQPAILDELCPDESLPPEEQQVLGALVRFYFDRDYCGGNIDYDAIYEACDCCK